MLSIQPFKRRIVRVLFVAIAALATLPGGVARADTLANQGNLPYPFSFGLVRATAIADTANIYLFGGLNGWGIWGSITRFNPSTGAFTSMSASLSPARQGASGIYDGSNFYLFGGYRPLGGGQATDLIAKYNAASDSATSIGAKLPKPKAHSSAIWTGRYAFIFGGGNGNWDDTGAGSSDIYRFDPVTESIATMTAHLPVAVAGSSAVWDGTYAYIAGGSTNTTGGTSRAIMRYNPTTDTASLLPQRLPYAVADAASFWNGQDMIVAGGLTSHNSSGNYYYTTSIQRFTPSTGVVGYMKQTISERSGMFGTWFGGAAWLFGGQRYACMDNGYGGCTTEVYMYSDVFRYTMEPGPPGGVFAYPNGLGSNLVSWNTPDYTTYTSSLTSYRIYRYEYLPYGSTALRRIAEVPANYGNYYVDTQCPLGALCEYTVSAVNVFGESPKTSYGYSVGT
ncbi:MAG: kelch repeat-containing protein [Actinomycetota bacterium]